MTEKETCVEKSPSLTPPSLFKLNLKGSKIELKEHQIEHNDILNKIMLKYPVVCDFSVMGSGKSFVSSNIALTNELKFNLKREGGVREGDFSTQVSFSV